MSDNETVVEVGDDYIITEEGNPNLNLVRKRYTPQSVNIPDRVVTQAKAIVKSSSPVVVERNKTEGLLELNLTPPKITH